MREVDTSETSVVWPAWCYSGETTVNEDLPQRLVAAAAAAAAATAAAATAAVSPSSIVLLAQQKQKQRARRQKEPQQQQHSSSNQSRSSSASSASVSSSSSSSSSASSPSPSPSPASPISPHTPARPPGRSRGKRKSITRTTRAAAFGQSPSALTAGSAIAAALEAGSVASATPGGHGLHRLQRSSPSSVDSACAATLCDGRSVGEGNGAARVPKLLSTGQPRGRSVDERRDAEQEAERVPEHGSVKNYHFGAIDTRVLRQHQATLHSLDKMLSERIYDRKKYLNSPTGGGSASGGGVVPASASAFYEKLRNGGGTPAAGDTGVGGAAMIESQLNLIKNGGGPGGINGTSAHLSAIAASIISNNNNNNNNSSNNNNNNNNSNNNNNNNTINNGISVSDGNGSTSLVGNGSNGALASPRSSSSSNSSSSHQINSNKTSNSSNSSSSNLNNNNNSNTNNNNISSSGSIKSERLSPANNDAQSMASRSRSVTPSSFSGTPPQTMHASEPSFPSSIPSGGLLPSPSAVGANAVGRPELQARNYSDFMRSLAAKYNNNNNTNDVSNIKTSFPEPKMRFTQPKSYIEGSLSGKKGSPLTSTQVPNPSIMTSLFSGLPFQPAVFPPLIDMSSTQALVTLARAAKESEIHNILKTDTGGGLKKPSSLSRGSSPPATSTSLSSHHFPSPFSTGYLPGLLPNHLASFPSQPPPSAALGGPLKSPSRAPEASALSTTFPLDLSASTPSASKRLRLSSPTPSRHQETSPAPSSTNSQPSADGSLDLKATRKCHARVEELAAWTVDNVCDFVASIDICAEYVQNFRDQSIDGAGLPLLTEEHLTNSLGMKLGPALKLRSMLAKKLGGPCPCALCSVPTPPPPPARTNSSGSGSSKGDTTPTNRPPSNGSIG